MSITIRQARPDDASAIYNMIYELAVYEKARSGHHPDGSAKPYLATTVRPKR